MNLGLLFLFGIGVLLIAIGWFQYWLYYKIQSDELEIVEAVSNITKPYNEKRLSKCNAMIEYVEKR